MPDRSWIDEVAAELWEEIQEIAEAVAEELEPPPDAYDGESVPRGAYIDLAREQSFADPGYVAADLEAMAPVIMTLPTGEPIRSPTGVKNFLAKWREARPDLYVTVVDAAPVQTAAPAAYGVM